MASSSLIPKSTMQDTAQGTSTLQQTPAYDIKRRKTTRKALTKDEYLDQATGSGSTILEEVQDLEPVKVLNKRTRSGKEVVPSPPQPSQPSIPKKKRKLVVRKLKIASKEEEDEDVVVQKALQLAREIEIPTELLARESTV